MLHLCFVLQRCDAPGVDRTLYLPHTSSLPPLYLGISLRGHSFQSVQPFTVSSDADAW
jgi:hypothetical protein